MVLIATLLVRDEADVVKENLKHHAAQGVDHIIAIDNGSQDGTVEILEDYAKAGLVELHHEPSQNYQQSKWVTFMARRAAAQGADWVLNIDADEFWVPRDRSRTLAQVLSEVPTDISRIQAVRTDLEGFANYGEEPWPRRLVWRNMRTVNENGKPLLPKICHRGDVDVTVPVGNHGAHGPSLDQGAILRRGLLDIYHVPRRSWQQFHTKIKNGGSAIESNPDLSKNVGWHWRSDYQRLLAGTLEKAYQKRCLTRSKLIRGILTRRYRYDDWLQNQLEGLS